MRKVAVAATAAELEPSAGRALWDRELLYRSMVRWGAGDVVPIEARRPAAARLRKLARGLSTVADASRGRQSPLRRRLRDFSQVEPVVVTEDVEVLYGHIVFPTSRRRPTVWSTQGVLDARPGMWFPDQSARTHQRMIRRAAGVQFWTRFGLEGVLSRVEVDERKIHVIPPLVYVDLPAPHARPSGDLHAIFIGAFGHMKGLDVILDAWRRLGAGLRLEVITNDAPPTDLPSSVEWLGPRPRHEVLARLASADLHVFTSTTESFGGVAAEALAAGVPQIVDHASVTTEVAGDAALAVPGRDAAAIADAAARIGGDADLRRRLAANALARYAAVYAPEVVGPQLRAVIDQA